jgi:DNA repair protein SbcC/Rad50
MRPVLLDLEGFGSFRSPSTVDFRDADHFALVGSTGAGKSTVIDAMVFALYGSVPRWDDRRAVGWALAPSVNRGLVRLVFDVAGSRYVVVRELRRSARGAVTVKNARLERLADPGGIGAAAERTVPLAADSEVSPAVERLLGLAYEHFVTCVVLPQGDFAEFLHEKPAKRQEVLARLLGLDVYRQVGQAANAEAAAQRQQADFAARRLEAYADATAEAEAAAAARIEAVCALAGSVAAAVPSLVRVAGAVAAASAECDRLTGERELLAALRVPAGLDALDRARRAAATALAGAEGELAVAEKADTAAREAREVAPDRGALERARDAWAELDRLAPALAAASAEQARREPALREVEAAGRAARAEVAAARAARDAAVHADQAAALRVTLVAGQPCPVCAQVVHELPPPAATTGDGVVGRGSLAAADARIAAAEAAAERLREEWTAASRALQSAAGRVEALGARVAELRATLDGQPDAAGAAAALADLDRVEAAARAADRALREARRRRDDAAREDQAARARLADARTALDRTRDPLVRLGAPPPGRTDLAADWLALAEWALAAADERSARLAAATAAATAARAELATRTDALAAALHAAGVGVPAGRPLAENAEPAVAAALQEARSAAARIAERRAEAAELVATRDAAEQEAQVAKLLGQVLRADGFERWLLASALDVLVADAGRTLLELSGGQFELTHDGKDFAVIDHADADSLRPVRTLSGGETFQASLALALALSTQLTGLAAAGAARLDAIVLDEGFGSLDEATLDVVAGTLESLTAGGDRMVGVVTHVAALAERVPVRFVVRRGTAGSTVVREDR